MEGTEFLAASSNSQLRSIVVPIRLDETLLGSRRGICIIHRRVSQRVCLRAWLNLLGEEPRGNLLYYYHCRRRRRRGPPNDFLSSRGRGISHRETNPKASFLDLLPGLSFFTGKQEHSVVVAR